MPPRHERGGVLLFADRARNASVLAEALKDVRVSCLPCADGQTFRGHLMSHGHTLETVVVTERSLAHGARDAIHGFQDVEPVWSELPIVLLSPHRHGPNRSRPLRNVILLHQPTAPRQFRSVVQLALETRAQQFEVQDLLQRLEEQRDWLAQALAREGDDVRSGDPGAPGRVSSRRRLLQRREEDRSMLARELHDTVIQRLLYLSMHLSPGIEMAQSSGRDDVAELIEEARGEAKRAVKDLRRLIRELRPAGLDMGFAAALEPTFARLRSIVDLRAEVEAAEDIAEDVVLVLYRIAREALRNIERHADATCVRVRIGRQEDAVVLWVADDGRGFDVPDRLDRLAVDDHFGLLGMEEFVIGVGGDLRIRSWPDAGTCVRASIPLS